MAEELTRQELASKIWESANRLRGKIKASEYKDYILNFMFYKFVSDKEERFLADNGEDKGYLLSATDEDVQQIKDELGYYIAYDDLFSTWKADGINMGVQRVSEALGRFNASIKPDYRHVYENIFSKLTRGLSDLGDTAGSRDKAVRDLIDVIDEIPAVANAYDVMGYVYEFLIYKFALAAAKDDGEFYTPHEVSRLISLILAEAMKNLTHIKVYDPTSGSAGLLLTVGNACEKYLGADHMDEIEYYGQEKMDMTFNLSRMNLVMKGIKPQNIKVRNGDTLEDDWPYFDENTPYAPVFVDAVVSNPPYSLRWEPDGRANDPRFKGYGLAPRSKADYAFLLHCLYHLKPEGVMGIVLPHGVLFRGGTEGAIRKQLIENRHIETIIGLPANLFFSTPIPTLVMILRKNRASDDVLFVDASKEFVPQKKQNQLSEENVKRIFRAVMERKDVDKFAHLASKQEIVDNGYNLNIPRYVDTFEKEPEIDLDEVRARIADADRREKAALDKVNSMMAELGLPGVL